MTLKNNYQDQQELSDFIKDKILGDSFDFDRLTNLREYITANNTEDNGYENGAFCDYYELGNWFWEAMDACDLAITDLLDEVEQDLEISYREAERDRAELEDDYLRMVGAR